MGRTRGAGAGREGHPQGVVWPGGGKAAAGRPRMRWVDNVRQVAISLGVRDWQAAALNRGRWKDLVEAAVGLQAL